MTKTVNALDTKKSKAASKLEQLNAQVEKLEHTIRMMAHFNGTNRVLDECGLNRWEPSKSHMKKHG
jgi:hypothetical protein